MNQLKERQVDKLRLSSLLSKYVNRWFAILSIEILQAFEKNFPKCKQHFFLTKIVYSVTSFWEFLEPCTVIIDTAKFFNRLI